MINKEEDYRDKILKAIDEGYLTAEEVVEAAMKWMSDDEAKQFAHANEFDDIEMLSQEEKDDFEL